MTRPRHVMPPGVIGIQLGLPYPQAGADEEGHPTATCGTCGETFTGATHGAACRAHDEHFVAAAAADAVTPPT